MDKEMKVKDGECQNCDGKGCVACDATKFPEPIIVESTTFDERKKILMHRTQENKTNELGDLTIISKADIHEVGIRNTIKDLEQKKKYLKESIRTFEEAAEPAPKMNAELEALKQNLKILQLIEHQKNVTPENKKKEIEQLSNCKKDLEKVETDLKSIRDAIGTRMKL